MVVLADVVTVSFTAFGHQYHIHRCVLEHSGYLNTLLLNTRWADNGNANDTNTKPADTKAPTEPRSNESVKDSKEAAASSPPLSPTSMQIILDETRVLPFSLVSLTMTDVSDNT